MNELDEHLKPLDSPITRYHENDVTAFDLDSTYERGALNNAQIKDNSITDAKLSNGGTITTGNIQDGAVSEAKIASFAVTSSKIGTAAVTNAKINDFAFSKGTGPITGTAGTLSGMLIGTSIITGGTVSGVLLGTSTVTGGTISGVLLGTSTITGGTVNPGSFSIAGTAGATGTAVYVKTITGGTASDWGTIAVVKGLVISIT